MCFRNVEGLLPGTGADGELVLQLPSPSQWPTRADQHLESMLRCVAATNPSLWSTHLLWTKYACNYASPSPFEVSLGHQLPMLPPPPRWRRSLSPPSSTICAPLRPGLEPHQDGIAWGQRRTPVGPELSAASCLLSSPRAHSFTTAPSLLLPSAGCCQIFRVSQPLMILTPSMLPAHLCPIVSSDLSLWTVPWIIFCFFPLSPRTSLACPLDSAPGTSVLCSGHGHL